MIDNKFLLNLLNVRNRVHRHQADLDLCCPNCGSVGNWARKEERDRGDIHPCFLCGFEWQKYIKLMKELKK